MMQGDKRPADPRLGINDSSLSAGERLVALRSWVDEGRAAKAAGTDSDFAAFAAAEVNNHIHTIYSFSPYTPSMAALRAFEAGLGVAGSVDHDSISASREMTEACAILGLGGVTGCELRVSFREAAEGGPGAFASRKINNPDSPGIVYMTIQGVPAYNIDRLDGFLAPIRMQRDRRTAAMAMAASRLLEAAGIEGVDFAADIVPLSMAREGGGITERHLCRAVAVRMMARYGPGPRLAEGLAADFGIPLAPRAAALLSDPANPIAVYDLINVLKAGFLDRIFIQPDESECIPVREAVDFARAIGAIPAYAYLGDVGESPTGDKKAEKFEDDWLDELFDEIGKLGFLAVTYMPPRNTPAQLERVKALCAEHGFMEISGVDINQPRQTFNCPELRRPEFAHLVDTTWALVAHEKLASADPRLGLFRADSPVAEMGLAARLRLYARAGRMLDPRRPAELAEVAAFVAEGGSPT